MQNCRGRVRWCVDTQVSGAGTQVATWREAVAEIQRDHLKFDVGLKASINPNLPSHHPQILTSISNTSLSMYRHNMPILYPQPAKPRISRELREMLERLGVLTEEDNFFADDDSDEFSDDEEEESAQEEEESERESDWEDVESLDDQEEGSEGTGTGSSQATDIIEELQVPIPVESTIPDAEVKDDTDSVYPPTIERRWKVSLPPSVRSAYAKLSASASLLTRDPILQASTLLLRQRQLCLSPSLLPLEVRTICGLDPTLPSPPSAKIDRLIKSLLRVSGLNTRSSNGSEELVAGLITNTDGASKEAEEFCEKSVVL